MIDQKELYHFEASLKDLGRSGFLFENGYWSF